MYRPPPELFRRGGGVPACRLTADGAAFLPNVLANDVFARDGILFGLERLGSFPLHWAVVDPSRHAMFVWRKNQPSFPRAALDLNATLFSNGPFTNYADGALHNTTLRFAREALPKASRALARRDGTGARQLLRETSVRHFQARVPLGFVIGTREGIEETAVSRPRVFHFGRSGLRFQDYHIGRGDPVGLSEAIGGLFGGVSNYRPYTVDQFIRVGYWGIAPVRSDLILRQHGIERAMSSYRDRTGVTCDGVLLTVAGLANTRRLTRLLSAARVRDAVQIDGGDSLLLGGGRVLRQGTFMPEWKRLLQCWGVQFQARGSSETS